MFRTFSSANRSDLCRLLADRLIRQLALDLRWSRRQMYVVILVNGNMLKKAVIVILIFRVIWIYNNLQSL